MDERCHDPELALASPHARPLFARSVLLDVYLVFLWVMCGLVCDKRDRRVTEDCGSFSGPFESPAPALDCRSLYDSSPYSDDLMNSAASLAPPRSWVSGIERSPPFYGHFDSFTQSCLLYLHLLLFPFLLALLLPPIISLPPSENGHFPGFKSSAGVAFAAVDSRSFAKGIYGNKYQKPYRGVPCAAPRLYRVPPVPAGATRGLEPHGRPGRRRSDARNGSLLTRWSRFGR